MLKYSELTITSDPSATCGCREYKGLVDCTECGAVLCLFCDAWCNECGENIDWSA